MSENILTAPVAFTKGAIDELKRLMDKEDFNNSLKLRVGVKGGGCSGMSYILGFEDQADQDKEFEIEGIPCIIKPSHEMYLQGMEIDWEGGLGRFVK